MLRFGGIFDERDLATFTEKGGFKADCSEKVCVRMKDSLNVFELPRNVRGRKLK